MMTDPNSETDIVDQLVDVINLNARTTNHNHQIVTASINAIVMRLVELGVFKNPRDFLMRQTRALAEIDQINCELRESDDGE